MRRRAPRALAGGALVLAVGSLVAPDSPAGVAERMPGPSPRGHTDPAAANAACTGCHQDIAREWEGSLHRHAADDADYLRSLAAEPLPFCRGCHAPEVDARVETSREGRALGVACVSCHEVKGHTLAAPSAAASNPARATPAPHDVTRSAAFGGDGACAGCHEFTFPDARGAKMQLTVTEHAASDARERSCASCHMPRVTGSSGRTHASHAFVASRSPSDLARAISVEAVREGESAEALRLRFRVDEVGHAFPTGDLFRRLEIIAEVIDGDTVIDRRFAFLAREQAPRSFRGALVRADVADTRLRGPTERVIDLGRRAIGHRVRWTVVYQRIAFPRGADPQQAESFGDTVLARGET